MSIDNIWFYTLSTSAQVLSALAGLFAVFVVWKIQEFEKIFSETRLSIIKIISTISGSTKNYDHIKPENLYFMLDLQILDKFSELLSIKNSEPNRISASHFITHESLVRYTLDEFTKKFYADQINKRSKIFFDLKKVLIINFLVISLCILALTFSANIFYKNYILIFISILVLYCLYLISSSIYKISTK